MDERGTATIDGSVNSVVYRNQDNGYTVLRLRLASGETATVVGCIPGVSEGEGLTATGKWESHPSYGAQFRAEYAERRMPSGVDAIYEYLASGVIKGVGARTAQLLVAEFGASTLRVIEDEPERLTDVRGITEKKAAEIHERFLRVVGLRRLMDFFAEYSVPPFAAARLYRVFGEDARAEVTANPYILAGETFGLDFFRADEFALKLGFRGDSPERIEAAVRFELSHNQKNGHVFIPRDKLVPASAQLIGVSADAVETAIDDLEDGDYIIEETVAGVRACYLDDIYRDETYAAKRISDLASMHPPLPANIAKLIERAETRCTVKFADIQREAIIKAAENGILVLTGGPGTGKTTTVRGILELFDELGLDTLLTAPTGRAAKRLSELTGREAQTVHRLLGAGAPEAELERVFQKCESDRLDCDAVILDETSMMDISLMAALLEAMPPRARLVLVGDADQLPSVGPGNVFSDIIRSGAVETVRLSQIFRQAEKSDIVKCAHLINSGTVPEIRNTGDAFMLKRIGAENVADTVVGLIAERLPAKMGIPAGEIQVLSPSRKTGAGTGELNRLIQARLNPPAEGKRERAVKDFVFRVGDRVMQTRNNYDIMWYRALEGDRREPGAGIYNGDVGYIEDIDEKNEYALIRFEDRITPYPFDSLGDLELAYAMTVHKSQGSEYRAVVLAIPQGVPMLKTRGVLYTAVTRARELLVVVGADADFAEMVHNDRRQRRYSGLRARLAGETEN